MKLFHFTALFSALLFLHNNASGVVSSPSREAKACLVVSSTDTDVCSNACEAFPSLYAVLLGVVVILTVLCIATYHYHGSKRNRKRIEEVEQFITRNEVEIAEYKRELSAHADQKEEKQHVIDELKGRIALLTNQNRNLTERIIVLGYENPVFSTPEQDLYLSAFRILISMKNGANRKLSGHDHILLTKLFGFLYKDYTVRLKNEFKNITRHEIELCCLLRFGFTNRELCSFYNTALESVRKSRSRLKLRLKVPNGQSLESFLASYC